MKLQFEINEKMVNLIPQASESDRTALKMDIVERWEHFGKDKALLQNILLGPDGRVIDGRTRLEILAELNLVVPEDKIERLPYGTSEEHVIMAVKSANMRRNLTTTQKVFMAMRSYLLAKEERQKVTLPGIAKSFNVGSTTLKNAMYINTKSENIANTLWAGKSIDIINSKGEKVTSSSVNSVCQYLKRLEEESEKKEEHEWKADSNIKTQAGKDWYYSQIKLLGINCPQTKMMIAELANYKFTKGK